MRASGNTAADDAYQCRVRKSGDPLKVNRMLSEQSNQTPCDVSDSAISDAAIAQRAYELWEARGCPAGESDVDWEEATRQLHEEARAQCRPNESHESCARGRGVLLRLFDRIRQRAAM